MGGRGKCVLCIMEAEPLAEAAPSGAYVIRHRDLAAVVRDVSLPLPQPTRQDLVGHLRAIEQLMAARTVIPLGFGSIALSEKEISDNLLASRYDEWRALLARLAGRVELGVKALWREMAPVLAEVVAEREAIRARRDELARRPQAATRSARIQIGTLVAEAVEEKRRREAAELLEALASLAVETRSGKLLGERMILNAAFLVERAREPEFDGAVSRLAEARSERLQFKYVGPAPPFNFVGA